MNQIDESKILITGGNGRLGKACKKILPLAMYPRSKTLDVRNLDTIESFFKTNTKKYIFLVLLPNKSKHAI